MPRGDSISSYDRSHEMYHSRPSLKQLETYKNQKASIQDTLANSAAAKEERWSPPKVEPAQFQVPKDKVIDIGRAGRFIFRTIVTPAYILIIQMPKWVATEFLPQVFAQLQKGFQQGKYWLELAGKWLANQLNTPFRTFMNGMNWAMQAIQKKAYDLMSFLQGGYQAFINGLKRYTFLPVQNVFQNIKSKTENFRKRLSDAFKKMPDRAKNTYKNTRNFLKNQAQKLYQQALVSPFQWMVNKTKNAYGKAKIALSKINKTTEKAIDNVKVPFQKGKAAVDKAQQTIQTQVAQVLQVAHIAAMPIVNFFAVPFNNAIDKVKLGLNWGKRKGKGKYKQAKEKVQKVARKISDGSKRIKTFFAMNIRRFLTWLFGPFVKQLCKRFPIIPKTIASARYFISSLKRNVIRGAILFKEFIVKASANAISTVASVSKKVVKVIYRPKSFLVTAFKIARYGAWTSLILIRGFCITIYAFCYISYLFFAQGMVLVREVSGSLNAKGHSGSA